MAIAIPGPVLRGWRAFRFDDEPYWNNYFGKDGPAKNVTPLVSTMLPPGAPKKETVDQPPRPAWQRKHPRRTDSRS